MPGKVHIERDLTDVNWTRMKEIYESVGWMRHTETIIQRVFQASNIVALAFFDGLLVGFGRALSDGVFNAAIYDVIVHRDYQGKGIGKAIVGDLLAQLQSVSCVHLISTTGKRTVLYPSGIPKGEDGVSPLSQRGVGKRIFGGRGGT